MEAKYIVINVQYVDINIDIEMDLTHVYMSSQLL